MSSTEHPFRSGLDRNAANFAPLTPVSFLERAGAVYPGKTAVIHGELAYSYREFGERVRRLASVLAARGIGRGDTVAIIAPNVPALLEAHYAVPGLGAVLNALNYRLDAATIAFCLEHGEAKVLIADRGFRPGREGRAREARPRDLRGRHRRCARKRRAAGRHGLRGVDRGRRSAIRVART